MDDPVVASLPIYLSTALAPNLQLYQYPLLQRPLQVPPSAKTAGKRINARFKPETDVIEIHVPFDTREDVWNKKQGREYGQFRHEEDGQKATSKEEKRLDDLRLKSERIREGAAYMVGIIRDSELSCFCIVCHCMILILLQINCISTVFRRPTNSVQT
jgi:DNA-directed RNA polymerase III subunit RPC5